MPDLLIAIDPKLTKAFAPEIHWTLRTLLSGIGWSWEEVSPNHPCDVAYVCEPETAPCARLCVQADLALWEKPSSQRLGRIEKEGELSFLTYQGAIVENRPLEKIYDRIICHHDLFFDFFWLLTGQEERWLPKDSQGFFDLNGTPYQQQGANERAVGSQIGRWIEKTLNETGCLPPPVPRWPENKQIAVGLGHDVDYPEVKRLLEPLRIINRLGAGGIKPAMEVLAKRRHHWQFQSWIDFERAMGIHSAFYFVARQGSLIEYATGLPDPFYDITTDRFHKLFDELEQAGCEIGLQASYLAYQTKDKFMAEKQRLEAACGCSVMGNRHHYWHMNPDDVESTLLIHEQVGFVYDSSLVHDRYLGWRRGSAWPFFPYHQSLRRQIKTLQLPVAWMDDQEFGFQENQPGNRQKRLSDLADVAARQSGALIIDIHEYVFDPVLFPGWVNTLQDVCEYLKVKFDSWFATPYQIAQHWNDRYTNLLESSMGLGEGI